MLAGMVSQTVLFLIILTVLRNTGQVFCRMTLSWDLFDIFLMVHLRPYVYRKKTTKVKCHSHLTISRINIISIICHWHFYAVLFGRKSLCSPHLMSGTVCFSFLRMEYLHKLLGIFLQPEISFSLIFIQSFISVWTPVSFNVKFLKWQYSQGTLFLFSYLKKSLNVVLNQWLGRVFLLYIYIYFSVLCSVVIQVFLWSVFLWISI